MHDLTAFERDLLWVIAGFEDPPIGLRVKERTGEYYGAEINHGRLYPALDRLADRELIDKSQRNKRSNTYTLTTAGKNALAGRLDWQQEQNDAILAVVGDE